MKYTLKEYQADAVGQMLTYFADARDDYHRKGRSVSFSLAATTGAGKTVMASAVIEGLFFGDPDWDFEADPGAVVLWFTDDPSLNEQTKARILDASGDRIAYSRLQVIENTFNREKFEPGKVYFLNSQKLSKNSLLVRGAVEAGDTLFERGTTPDLRQHTIWDTIRNTIEDDRLTLYLVLDEAHKGMRRRTTADNAEQQTIVKRLINGANGVPPIPVVWGISATIERFTEAMKDVEGRYPYPHYEIDPALIQESGLLKDDIRLDFPAKKGTFDTVLLKRGTRKVKAAGRLWEQYAETQDSPATRSSRCSWCRCRTRPRRNCSRAPWTRFARSGLNFRVTASRTCSVTTRPSRSGTTRSRTSRRRRCRRPAISVSCSLRTQSPPAGTAPAPRCWCRTGPQPTRRTSPSCSGAWSAHL
ncbi:DEAD/DEAH box helicase [Streptomyces nogalater]